MSGGDKLDFEIRPNPARVSATDRAALLANPGFGRVFTDHMVTVRYAEGKGWYDARVEARAPIPMDPASAVLHYAQEIFEGMKAYRAADGGVTMFRPYANAARFNTSAARMAMPALSEATFVDSLHQLIEIDREWIPDGEDGSLYLRPFMFASEVFLGVRPANEYLYVVIASPVGAYFSGGVKPVTVWVSPDYTRAAPGGTGAAKCGGNYAASLAAQAEAAERGCDQVVFLDAVERTYVDELGGMNVFFVYDDGSIATPPLTGTILPGITRESVIALAEAAGHRVEERPVSFADWQADAASGRLREVFACGTAAVITPIGRVRFPDGEFAIAGGEPGTVTMALRQQLVDLQRGKAADPHNWVHRVL
ncbi:branched-chain amino acid aminotransferase [Micromonospora endophytica]|uniref:Branched-chain-amino-acid aminotransferase n=1 Tax=Micromonospora endophytica TaxID=515350 RepID=A0A2W2E2P9_9ACTN|nr:branched-chain amino acid aminotransferase [Micromonospora endophytica]PZF99223.1 branched chain amino acid aminotransferase [Micromonospora endophytica]RIW45094.1 branched-chain amino acid aminotransferase [Micromonospora endophytica]BCJ58024.1 branched-chain-amino-acid aminotransferase [Micromonospora endophytica]